MDHTQDSIIITLLEAQMWQQFDSFTNEMQVLSPGKHMIPIIELSLSGLEPNAVYKIMLEFRLVDRCKYRYVKENEEMKWKPGQLMFYIGILGQTFTNHSKMQKDGCAKYIPNFAFKFISLQKFPCTIPN